MLQATRSRPAEEYFDIRGNHCARESPAISCDISNLGNDSQARLIKILFEKECIGRRKMIF